MKILIQWKRKIMKILFVILMLIEITNAALHEDILNSDTIVDGLDPSEYFALKRRERLKKRNRYKSKDLRGSASSTKKYSPSRQPPRAEFLIPNKYEPPPPDCSGGSGDLSGITFLTFLMSAIAVAANVISNINSNQRNNNNNNNDNNDNVANFNFANNNNAGNNLNNIMICKSFFLDFLFFFNL